MAKSARIHGILARSRPFEGDPSRFEHFQLDAGTPAPPDTALGPGWSLYCLDPTRRAALFVELPRTHDLSRAPFAYLDQFAHARRALAVPLDTLPGLAERVPLPNRLILVFSIGRCRSTLVSRLLGEIPGVWSLSEPDGMTGLALDRNRYPPDEIDALAAAAVRLSFAPPDGATPSAFAVKPRSQAMFQAASYHRAFPDAAFLFLYRDAESWTDSFYGLVQKYGMAVDPRARDTRKKAWDMLTCATPHASFADILDIDAEAVPLEEVLALTWALQIEQYMSDLEAGVPYRPFRHDDLSGEDPATVGRLLTACGLTVADLPSAMAAFRDDSQTGTAAGRAHAVARLDQVQRGRVHALLARYPRITSATLRLPGAAAPEPQQVV